MVKFIWVAPHSSNPSKKPVKHGFKVWVRADSWNRYISDFEAYIGKEESAEVALGPKVPKLVQVTSVSEVGTICTSITSFDPFLS